MIAHGSRDIDLDVLVCNTDIERKARKKALDGPVRAYCSFIVSLSERRADLMFKNIAYIVNLEIFVGCSLKGRI
jgi:hypothetical protein